MLSTKGREVHLQGNQPSLSVLSGVILPAVMQGLSVYVTEGGSSRERLCHDLTETTLDLLAHYTHSNISTLPSRSDTITDTVCEWVWSV